MPTEKTPSDASAYGSISGKYFPIFRCVCPPLLYTLLNSDVHHFRTKSARTCMHPRGCASYLLPGTRYVFYGGMAKLELRCISFTETAKGALTSFARDFTRYILSLTTPVYWYHTHQYTGIIQHASMFSST